MLPMCWGRNDRPAALARRLAKIAGGFDAAAHGIAAGLRATLEPEPRLRLLLTRWGFLLPTASAILAVLYPDTFTVYDERVCDALGDFHQLRRSENLDAVYESVTGAAA